MQSPKSPKSPKPAVIASAVAVAGILFTGCSASKVVNTGGDTQCKDFTNQGQGKQSDEVSKMLTDKNGTPPSNLKIDAARLGTQTWCQTVGKPNSKISEAPSD